MTTWFQPFPLNSGDSSAWLNLLPENSYRVVSPSLVPAPVASALLAKCDSVLLVRSGSKNEEFVVANLYRKDHGKIDQMPFGTAFISGSGSAAVLTHHGDWLDRTASGSKNPPTYGSLSNTGSGIYEQCFATLVLPTKESGHIEELDPKTNVFAFHRVIEEIRNQRK